MKKCIVLLIVLGTVALFTAEASAELTVIANHSHIDIDWNYHGSSVSLKGKTDPDVELVAILSSGNVHQSLKTKEKVGGLLWMNTGDVTLDNLPDVYFLQSSSSPEEILSQEEMDRYGIGYDALKKVASISQASGESTREKLFQDFVRYKEDSNLYAATVDDFAITDEGGGHYYTQVKWPYEVQPGTYEAKVYAVRDHKVVDHAEANVKVELSGVVAKLTDAARNNGALYGIVAILTALATGFGAGMIFKKPGGAH